MTSPAAATPAGGRSRGYRVVLALCVLLAAWTALGSLLDPEAWQRRQQLREDLLILREENAAVQEQIKALEAEIHALRTRPEVQERVIRRELGYVRPGELLIKLEPSASDSLRGPAR